MSTSDPRVAASAQGENPEPEEVTLDHAFDGDGLYGMRATISAHADLLGIDNEQLQQLLIVAGELASNAVRHGGGRGRLRLWRDGARLCCQVSDAGTGISEPASGTTQPAATQIGGRGLWIVRNLSAELFIRNDAPGTTVTAVISAG
ncbi:anti-sigma regulatory factor (Ser/Thr protein kinase) [Micromonospora pisi]|uniref:Anti-sigma regulatory factor (Ser/Thr protein kinase) n=1 Tax=Micromonospora pisi TaxID=589240 RepID=A0A495JFW8_9ACTN|nr:ATP-binding protein [Micromonospora pisi]RKR87807.1 anti-sigma regulatory factor (Ser/Thr protein kinase) [Micromonospora pisi]